jgi:hypothetical protein
MLRQWLDEPFLRVYIIYHQSSCSHLRYQAMMDMIVDLRPSRNVQKRSVARDQYCSQYLHPDHKRASDLVEKNLPLWL